ncbi:MAG: helix-turn-helix domain-containing protein, partial [Acidobacteria bacterium]
MYIIVLTKMAKKRREPEQAKLRSLQEQGVLHPHPERVRDPAFQGAEFFDPHDRVQVKYEMVRRHQVEGKPVSEVAEAFGVSRQAFYQAETAFEAKGLVGLVPARPGPRRAHKCTPEV